LHALLNDAACPRGRGIMGIATRSFAHSAATSSVLLYRYSVRATAWARRYAPLPSLPVCPPAHLIASGLVGEPTAPVIGIAGATNMNS
jgi:hypothetical protein